MAPGSYRVYLRNFLLKVNGCFQGRITRENTFLTFFRLINANINFLSMFSFI